jgi:DNA-binding transcriptional LysR family regulator
MSDALPDLNARQLRAVLAVAEYRSFIAAASALNISQPALTRTIKQVEVSLGVPLFSRTTRQVTMTAAGKEFASLAERVLNDLKIGVDNVRRHGAEPQGQVIVASVLSLAGAMLPKLISAFSMRFPGIEIHLREGLHANVVDDVRAGAADFGIGYGEAAPEAFVCEDLGSETYHLVLPTGHPLARQPAVRLNALKGLSLVSFPAESQTRRMLDKAAAAEGQALRYVITANRLPTLFALVRQKVGLTVVPASERPSASDRRITSRPLVAKDLSVRLAVLRLRDRELSLAAAEFIGVVKNWLAASRR